MVKSSSSSPTTPRRSSRIRSNTSSTSDTNRDKKKRKGEEGNAIGGLNTDSGNENKEDKKLFEKKAKHQNHFLRIRKRLKQEVVGSLSIKLLVQIR